MSETFFITGSDTSVGKTFVTTSLVHQLRAQKKAVSALKPVISGFAEGEGSDTEQLLRAMSLAVNPVTIDAISPWRFAAPLAPSIAAAQEGRDIVFPELIDYCTLPRVSDIILIEGAGGVMAPLNSNHTVLDWMVTLDVPVIMVVGTYLGAVSHALTAGEVMLARGLKIQAVVVSESENAAMDAAQTAMLLKPYMPYAKYIVPLPRVAGEGNLWQHTADLTWILT